MGHWVIKHRDKDRFVYWDNISMVTTTVIHEAHRFPSRETARKAFLQGIWQKGRNGEVITYGFWASFKLAPVIVKTELTTTITPDEGPMLW